MKVKKPVQPLPNNYRPLGSVAYKVKDGDTWWSIASKAGLNPWWLIQYNFETRNPKEVNWYLANRVGCSKSTPDGNNFRFSSADNPGVIYVTTPQVAKANLNLSFGNYGIKIEGDEDYKSRTKATLEFLAKCDTGLVLLNAIKKTGKEFIISPWSGTACNATASAADLASGIAKGGTYPLGSGADPFQPLEDYNMVKDLLGLPQEPLIGTGKGSDTVINFSPTMWGYGGSCNAYSGMPGSSPSQILFHELAHAYRFAKGAFNGRPTVGGSANYTNLEEFFAITLTNVMISDPTYSAGNRTLRADHAGFSALAPNLSTSHGFVGHQPNATKMKELISSDPALVAELKKVNSYFNPFAENL